jgi:hypothetical protein
VNPKTGKRTYFGVHHAIRYLCAGIGVVGAACTPLQLLASQYHWTDVLITYAFCSFFYLLFLLAWRYRLVVDRGGLRRVGLVARRTRRDKIRSVEMAPRPEVFSPWVPEMILTSGAPVELRLLRGTSGGSAPPDGLLEELSAIREVLGLGRWDARTVEDRYVDDLPERFVLRSVKARASLLATFGSFGLLAVGVPLGSFGQWSAVAIGLYLSAVVVVFVWPGVRSWRIGARFDTSGVVVRTLLHTRRLRWDEIDSFADGVTSDEDAGERWALRIVTRDDSSVTVHGVERSPATLTRLRRVATLHHIPAQLTGEIPP